MSLPAVLTCRLWSGSDCSLVQRRLWEANLQFRPPPGRWRGGGGGGEALGQGGRGDGGAQGTAQRGHSPHSLPRSIRGEGEGRGQLQVQG